MVNMGIPQFFQPLKQVILLLVLTQKLLACDPILESILFSQGRLDRMDSALRDLSTHLSDIGRQARDNIPNNRSLAEAKVLWLQVYQNYYLSPPEYFAKRLKEWQESLDKIAHKIKELANLLLDKRFSDTHVSVLELQSSLVGLYRPMEERGFFERQRAIVALIGLLLKVRQENLAENQYQIESNLKKILPLHLEEARNKSSKVESILKEDLLQMILTIQSEEDEKNIQSQLMQIQIRVFEDEQ